MAGLLRTLNLFGPLKLEVITPGRYQQSASEHLYFPSFTSGWGMVCSPEFNRDISCALGRSQSEKLAIPKGQRNRL